MIELKNCPNCGGILDDTGRCMYCKSKVYNLTDVNINFDTRDILVFKIKQNGYDTIFSAYPTTATLEVNNDVGYACDSMGNKLLSFNRGYDADLHMEFSLVKSKEEPYELVTIVKENEYDWI